MVISQEYKMTEKQLKTACREQSTNAKTENFDFLLGNVLRSNENK